MPTSNMGLPIPTVSSTGGPQWATDNNSCFTLIDAHDHTPGNGVYITPGGLNINSDLTFASNNAIALRSVRFTAQAAPLALGSDLGCLYESGVDLYFNDGNGNQVRITSSGGVAGSPGSIGSLSSPAAADYVAVSTKFVWTADTNKFAAMENGAVTIYETNNNAATNGITLASPTSLASAYTLTFPAALPASTKSYIASSTGGTLTMNTPNTIASEMTATGANSIAATRTRAVTTDGTDPGAGGVSFSGAVTSFSDSSGSLVDVTGLATILTTSGRPVFVGVVPDGTNSLNYSHFGVSKTSGDDPTGFIKLVRGSTVIAAVRLELQVDTSATENNVALKVPPGSVFMVDAITAGTYTYKVQVQISTGSGTITVNRVRLIAYEL